MRERRDEKAQARGGGGKRARGEMGGDRTMEVEGERW